MTFSTMKAAFPVSLIAAASVLASSAGQSADAVKSTPAFAEKLRQVQVVTRDDLRAVVRPAISPDGRYLYAAAWQAGAIVLFHRDAKSGRLEHRETWSNAKDWMGVTGFEVRRDGKRAVAAAFISGTVTLLERDLESGRLSPLQVVRKSDPDVAGLDFVVRAGFPPKGDFVYATDGGEGGLTTFAVSNRNLVWLETNPGTNGCLASTRGLAISTDGKRIYTASSRGGSLASFTRDAATGRTTLAQVLRDEQDDAHGLQGAFGVAVSPDDKFAYTCAGRFIGDHAVSAFAVKPDGSLEVLQEFINGEGEFQNFIGGNSLTVSPDGRHVYAVATQSGAVANFERDLATGKLKLLEVVANDSAGRVLAGAAGVVCSADSRFVYVAAEAASSLVVFEVEK